MPDMIEQTTPAEIEIEPVAIADSDEDFIQESESESSPVIEPQNLDQTDESLEPPPSPASQAEILPLTATEQRQLREEIRQLRESQTLAQEAQALKLAELENQLRETQTQSASLAKTRRRKQTQTKSSKSGGSPNSPPVSTAKTRRKRTPVNLFRRTKKNPS